MKFYGPYLREKKQVLNNLWHWYSECEEFPKTIRPESMVSSSRPDDGELCNNCLQIEKSKKNDGYHNAAEVLDNHNSIYSENLSGITHEELMRNNFRA